MSSTWRPATRSRARTDLASARSDILVINKTDLAPYVGASLEVMDHDSRLMRSGKPYLFTNCKTGEGIPQLVKLIRENVLFDLDLVGKEA